MSEVLNYPIKYALLKLKKEDKELGYIVSKCYILESFEKYNKNGESKIGFNVVFPYSKIKSITDKVLSFDENRIIPSDTDNNSIDVVDILYDDFYEAKKHAYLKNKELLNMTITSNVSFSKDDWKEQVLKIKKNFNNNISLCKEFENFITDNTMDMNITQNDFKQLKLINN